MKILVTGAKGFVGKNLVSNLYNVKEGKDRTRNIVIDEIYEFDRDSDISLLDTYCRDCDFVFNLAGVNRPIDNKEFMEGNFGFSSILLDTLKKYNNKAPVMLSSSIQASLIGRYAESDYGKSKLAGEELFFKYGIDNDVRVFVYRFPNLFGKGCRPNYNSVIATFCYNIARDLDISVNDSSTLLNLVYIDDVIDEMFNILEGKYHYCYYDGVNIVKDDKRGKYCYIDKCYSVTLGEVVNLLYRFRDFDKSLIIEDMPNDSFSKKLYSTYLSYLPKERAIFDLKMNCDDRGSFTELFKSLNNGQVSVNISKPGITKGDHWHNSKWEIFVVVSGHGLIKLRNIYNNDVIEYEVYGSDMKAIYMLPGYTHNIINLSDSEDLVTIMFANELFDKNHPDTFSLKVNS